MISNTCVTPEGKFIFGIHKPSYQVHNLRVTNLHDQLGLKPDGAPVYNHRNFPQDNLTEENGTWIYEIPNPFPFRGATFIKKDWADARAKNPSSIKLPIPSEVSLSKNLTDILGNNSPEKITDLFAKLPRPILLAVATTSTDSEDLVRLAALSCTLQYDQENHEPTGLAFTENGSGPEIHDHPLFETLVNNPHLPDSYKNVMVLKPGIQGGSEIVGEYGTGETDSHVFEYLRRNSYIAWGHYASNMANDAVRYSTTDLNSSDISGLRHLYYQRSYCRIAEELDIAIDVKRRPLTVTELENLRARIEAFKNNGTGRFNATLWGWNFGFDFAPSYYRLHASHQQIHQQYAMIPGIIEDQDNTPFIPYSCGDLIANHCHTFRKETKQPFFKCYLNAIRTNSRIDGRNNLPSSLVIYEDNHVILFVPKAQTSQWELNIICKEQIGNILECNSDTRASLDKAILTAQLALAGLGAKMVTSIEFSKRFDSEDNDQRLLYSLLPKLPESPGAFSESQLRFINGHYPEDFAEACRLSLEGKLL